MATGQNSASTVNNRKTKLDNIRRSNKTVQLEANSGVDIGDVDVTSISAGETHVGSVAGNSTSAQTVLAARPADTDIYAIGDVFNADSVVIPVAFTVARANDTTGWVIGGTATSTNTAADANIDLLLFEASFTTPADNVLFDPTDAEIQNYIGRLHFSSWTAYTANSISDSDASTPIAFVPASGTQLIYGVPVLANTYTPASGEVLTFTLSIEQN